MKKTFICPCCMNKFKAKLQSIMMCNKCKFFFSHNVVPNDTTDILDSIKEQDNKGESNND